MAAERRREPVREFQLEGAGLVLVGALVVGGLLAAFYAGRWYERGQHDAGAGIPSTGNPLAHVELPAEAVDVADQAGFFDVVEGGQKEAEPSRELRSDPPPPGDTVSAATPSRAAAEGSYFVQVFAGRDEKAATNLLAKLEAAGHSVLLHTDRQGTTTLYKVRVGGFRTQDLARTAADRLQTEGYPGAWVTRVE